ncbi:MAG TPA: winged helix-turn-helix domain-containing protein [Candidatus Saccharimonadales bacterium]|nr:winged helix-turn-helix domain-containing protein [Candidatus Saccharimonadales bacterium]
MTTAATIRLGELGEDRERRTFVGRDAELAALNGILEDDGPLVAFVHGLAGIGKSTLLMAFIERARGRGARIIQIDSGIIEPTERGFLAAVRQAIGSPADADPVARLATIATRVVLVVDSYEALRVSDAWFRQQLIGSLPANVRVVLAGREPPALSWFGRIGWSGSLATIELGALDAAAARQLLSSAGLDHDAAERVARIARGHPLALRVAAAAAGSAVGGLEELAAQQVLDALARGYVEQLDPLVRRALDAASVVRRLTPSLLVAMVPEASASEVFERLLQLPFVRSASDGLVLHEMMQQAIATRLRSDDAARERAYRQAAWRHLRQEIREAGASMLWRYTADMLFLVENPIVREAFFPTGMQLHSVEPAQSADGAAILEAIARHDGPSAAAIAHQWWDRAPEAFRAVRDREGQVSGFAIFFQSGTVQEKRAPADPIMTAWRDHLRRSPVPAGQVVLFARRSLDRAVGEGPGSVQGALFMETKRLYMELRPRLRRIYWASYLGLDYLPALTPLGFVRVPEADVELDGRRYVTLMNDFGPASIDGWLARIAASELGIPQDDLLDLGAHELVVDGQRVGLTKLEFELLHYLMERDGKTVTRAELLADVWGYSYAGDSNVVEVAVGALRRKLGHGSAAVATVRGVGYRYHRN